MMQPSTPPPLGPPKRNLSETVWTKLDRKATAIAEFTMRQYRKKRSTWTVGAIGIVLVAIVLLFYIDAMSVGFDSKDNDGDGLIDEDPSSWAHWENSAYANQTISGPMADDDGDCLALDSFMQDSNGDGEPCNVVYRYNSQGQVISSNPDINVDEDINEGEFLGIMKQTSIY